MKNGFLLIRAKFLQKKNPANQKVVRSCFNENKSK